MNDVTGERSELPEPGPMIPPVPAIVLGVKGDAETRDELTICWTFIIEGHPPHVGVSVRDRRATEYEPQVAIDFLEEHQEFTLNVPEASWVEEFDVIDMCASERADKFDRTGLTRIESEAIGAPGIAQAPIILECEVIDSHKLPPHRTLFHSEVVRTSVQNGVTDEDGNLDNEASPIFGMTAGNGEFWTFGEKVGRIGMTEGIDDIRY